MKGLSGREKRLFELMEEYGITVFTWKSWVFGEYGTLYNNGRLCKVMFETKNGTVSYLNRNILDRMVKKGLLVLDKRIDDLTKKIYIYEKKVVEKWVKLKNEKIGWKY